MNVGVVDWLVGFGSLGPFRLSVLMVQYSMERSSNELIEGIIDHIIDEETLGVCFEIHRSIKLQYYDVVNPDLRLDPTEYNSEYNDCIVD